MSDEPIQNCEVRFEFQCPKQWAALQETSEPGVRSCDHCQKRVYLCQSEHEVLGHARQGHCIAVPAGVLASRPSPDDAERTEALAARHGLSVIHLHGQELDPELLRLLPGEVARRYHMVPVSRTGPTLVMAMSDPCLVQGIDEVKFTTGYGVKVVVASRGDIEEALAQIERLEGERKMEVGFVVFDEEPEFEPQPEPSTPIERLLHFVLTNAWREKAEQVRFEATDSTLVIRYLVAGTLHEVLRPPLGLREALLRQLRDESDARSGQPGRLQFGSREQRVHYQVHLHLTDRGEEVVLHLLPEAY